MEPEDLTLFFNLFIQALDSVDPAYFSTQYNFARGIVEDMVPNQRNAIRRKIVGNAVVQTGERIFCYELYHQLRLLMPQHPQVFQNVCLQGELQKIQIVKLMERYGLTRLSSNFIPDFLLHSPATAEFHPYVIEVKADRFLTAHQVRNDISKLAEFITRYNYQRAIFLATIIDRDELFDHLISQNQFLLNISNIQEIAGNIFIVNKRDAGYDSHYEQLSNLLNF